MVECLSENTILELVAGALSGEERARAHLHIEACEACRTLVLELARDDDIDAHVTVPATAAAEPAARVLADRFELVRALGRGGMGTVHEALDRERGTRVAFKMLQHVSADGLLRFKTEFRALQDVHHPNLVALGELIEERGEWWLTMELVEGVGFVRHVRPGGVLDERRLRAALPQLAAGLSALHAHGLVHRDVKPHNVLVTSTDRVVLLDFGLVAGVAQSESNVVGTPAYMAPEQGLLEEIGPAADWYGVGALLYEALTGVPPFTGSPLVVMIAKQHELPRRPGELAPVPGDLDALCMQLLAIEPAARLAAAAALAELDPGAPRSPPAAAAPAFVGRHRELADLAGAFARTRKGAEAIVLIEGESGIGKTALVSQFLADLHRREPAVRVLAGRCYERETVPYKGVDGVIDALARLLRKLPETEVAAVLPRRAGLLLHAFPVLGKVAELRALPADDVVDRMELRFRAFTALRELLGRFAERGPVVVWIDDLQWADSDSLELLAWIMARPEAPPLLLLLTSWPPRDPAEGTAAAAALAGLRDLPGLQLVRLQPLPRDEAVALAAQLLAEHPAGAAASAVQVADEAAGHPLFIDALVQHAVARSATPPSLHLADALWGRIAALDPQARELLALIAVAGWPLPRDVLTAAAVLPAADIDLALVQLDHAHLVRAADRTGKRVEPYHDRIRETVLEQLDPEQRKACHRALAQALVAAVAVHQAASAPDGPEALEASPGSSSSHVTWGPELVAVHLHAAGDLDQAAQYVVRAADQAAAALAFDRAARLYRHALAIAEQSGASPGLLGDTRDVLARLAQALANACRGAEAATVYFELARKAEAAGEEHLELRLRGAGQLLISGHRDQGRRALTGVLAELDLSPAATRIGALWRLLRRRAWLRLRGLGSFAPDQTARRRPLSARDRLRLEACRIAWKTAEFPPEYFTRYQTLARATGDPRLIGLALHVEISIAAMASGAAARRTGWLVDQLAAAAVQSGDPYVASYEQTSRSLIQLELGDWARGREHGARAMQLLRERCLGASYETTIAAVYWLRCMFYMGDLRTYQRELLTLLHEAEERGDHFSLLNLLTPMGIAWLADDQSETARQQVERGVALWTSFTEDIRLTSGQLMLAMIDLYDGTGPAAYRRIEQDWQRRTASPLARLAFVRAGLLHPHGLAALTACRSGTLDRRLVRVAARDARDLRAMGMPWTSALARTLDAGVALVTGAPHAREQLERAHAELATAGMAVHAAVARRRLGELTGGDDGARMIGEVDALLAAQGVRAPQRFARLYMPEVT